MKKTFNDYRAALIGVGPATKERILADADKHLTPWSWRSWSGSRIRMSREKTPRRMLEHPTGHREPKTQKLSLYLHYSWY